MIPFLLCGDCPGVKYSLCAWMEERVSSRRPDILKFANWTFEEFDARVCEAVLNEGLKMDITIITDREWQQKFLAGEV